MQGVAKDGDACRAEHAAANEAFAAGRYLQAVQLYTGDAHTTPAASTPSPEDPLPPPTPTPPPTPHTCAGSLQLAPLGTAAAAALAAQLHVNRALALLRLGPEHAAAAVQDSTAALLLDPSSLKAHYRRAAALQLLHR
jgi:hypothetical protein